MFLAATYEIIKQPEKSVHCYAIALHMKPSDRNIALECATKSEGVPPPNPPPLALHVLAM